MKKCLKNLRPGDVVYCKKYSNIYLKGEFIAFDEEWILLGSDKKSYDYSSELAYTPTIRLFIKNTGSKLKFFTWVRQSIYIKFLKIEKKGKLNEYAN